MISSVTVLSPTPTFRRKYLKTLTSLIIKSQSLNESMYTVTVRFVKKHRNSLDLLQCDPSQEFKFTDFHDENTKEDGMNFVNSTSTKISANKIELKKALAKMLTNLITNKKWSDKEAAKELDIKQSWVSELSKGILKNITMDNMLDLFVKFGYESELKKSSIKDLLDITITKNQV